MGIQDYDRRDDPFSCVMLALSNQGSYRPFAWQVDLRNHDMGMKVVRESNLELTMDYLEECIQVVEYRHTEGCHTEGYHTVGRGAVGPAKIAEGMMMKPSQVKEKGQEIVQENETAGEKVAYVNH